MPTDLVKSKLDLATRCLELIADDQSALSKVLGVLVDAAKPYAQKAGVSLDVKMPTTKAPGTADAPEIMFDAKRFSESMKDPRRHAKALQKFSERQRSWIGDIRLYASSPAMKHALKLSGKTSDDFTAQYMTALQRKPDMSPHQYCGIGKK